MHGTEYSFRVKPMNVWRCAREREGVPRVGAMLCMYVYGFTFRHGGVYKYEIYLIKVHMLTYLAMRGSGAWRPLGM